MAKVADSTIESAREKDTPATTKTASAKALHLPATPSGTVTNSPENFFAYGKQLTSDQWSRTRGYLYRLLPAIRRKPSYIDRFNQPIDEDYILRHKLGGSGRYQILLNDRDGAGTFCKCILDINDPEFPPRYNIHELDLTSEDNRQLIEELKQEGKLNQNGDVIEQKTSESSDGTMAQALKDIAIEAMRGRKEQPGMENQAFSKMMEMMSNASQKSIDIALGQVKKEDPAAFLTLLTTAKTLFAPAETKTADPLDVLTKAKALFSSDKPTSDPMVTLLMQELKSAREENAKERQRNHDLQIKMLEAKTDTADPMSMVEKVLNIQEKLGGGGEPRNWKEKLVDQGLQYVPDILDVAKKAFSGGGYPRQPNGQQPPRPVQHQPQPPQPQQPAPVIHAQTQPQGETAVPQPPSDPDLAFLVDILYKAGERFVQAFQTDPNTGGHHVAKDVSFYGGINVYERIARMGREKILAAIQMVHNPNGEQVMYQDLMRVGTVEMLNDFIDDFIDGPEPPDDDQDDDDSDQEPGEADPIEERAGKDRAKVTA